MEVQGNIQNRESESNCVKNMKGGKRQGAGRPALSEDKEKVYKLMIE